MGTEADHREKADHNQKFLGTIDPKDYPDWVVTVCFYKAVHLVEMLFATSKRHSGNHRERHDVLKREYPDIWRQYHPLYTQSRRARYKIRSISADTVKYVAGRLAALEKLIDEMLPKKST